MHLVGGQRVDQVDPGHTPQIGIHRLPDHRGEMHRIHQLHVLVFLRNLPQGQHDVLHRLTVVLPPVAGDQDDLLLPVGQVVQLLGGKTVVRPHSGLQRVDDRVAGDKNPIGDSLFQEVIFVVHRGTEIQVRDGGDQLPIHFLRERRILVIGSEARFHVAHGDLMIERGQGAGKSGGGVAVDQDHVRLQLLDGLVHAGEGLAGDGGEGLPGRHDVQVPVGFYIKDLQHTVQHLAMLGGDAAKALHLRTGSQLLHQGAHLNCLRPGAEDAHDTKFFHRKSLRSYFTARQGGKTVFARAYPIYPHSTPYSDQMSFDTWRLPVS